MKTRALLIATITVGLAWMGHAQDSELGRAALATDMVPHSLTEAEAQGAAHPRAAANNSAAFSPVAGTAERKCVDAEGLTFVRSGDFVAGSFTIPARDEGWTTHRSHKLPWEPSQVTSGVPLVVRAARVDEPGDTRVFGPFSLVRGVDPATGVQSAGQGYASAIRLPSAGRWLLIATAGPNWGCYLVTVSPSGTGSRRIRKRLTSRR
jgi:hypothetical protein